MEITTIPEISRVEIRNGGKAQILRAATELERLAGELKFIAGAERDEETAMILAHHKIKATSQKLRGKQ
ncbi:hypothetical protein HB779_17300 [Phyllobacterium sp. 628]|uniref:hypothetical protein n=1 Tax=Phyllobacterium sp. 628 TaxID=2718938 RepID=UPI0016623D29|nr:hypothetical protein [Phyllobacterium sp. 628]QND53447.1 hypothetical protein HB779_17300 [Phyllobacterium sp. 628]